MSNIESMRNTARKVIEITDESNMAWLNDWFYECINSKTGEIILVQSRLFTNAFRKSNLNKPYYISHVVARYSHLSRKYERI